MRALKLGVSALAIVGSFLPASAEVFPRGSVADGAVVDRKSGEEVRFVDIEAWRGVEVNQDLIAGDTLRTNAVGSLAIRFSDNTLVRMARETVLRVRKIDGASDSQLNLEGGTIWGRAERGGSGLTVDTPAAAAAIRGTDWTLRAEGDRTVLTVLEGVVELSNAQGTVTVGQGEGAVATIGQAPRKYILVNLEEREQVLLYGEIRGVFNGLPISGEGTRDARSERLGILAKPETGRSREDWLKLAETALAYDGRAAAAEALAHLPRPLPAAMEARATLVEAMIAGQTTQYDTAIRLFRKALPQLSGERRTMALYGEWIAISLKDPDARVKTPSLNRTPATIGEAIAQATVVAHMQGQVEAIEILKRAERRFPDEASLPAMRASLAYELDRRDEVREALARARSLDPSDPSHLLVSARFRATVSSDLDGALADLTRAVEAAPGDDAVWNEIGIIQSDRNAIVEADAAHRRAIGLNPENAVLHANHARFLMDHDQMAAAKRAIDAGEALDPTSYAVLAAKGRYLLRMGKTAEGEKVLQEAAAVNPTAGDALIGLAIANYQSGASAETAQALDNADRFDRDNPSISLLRAGVALDQFRADDAIVNAREALRRRQARGGYYTGYDANRQVSSYLGVTLDNVGLTEWGDFYADRSFDPFVSTTYIDEAAGGRTNPFVGEPISGLDRFPSGGSSTASDLQARLLDPLSIASEEKRNSLETRTFFEASLGGTLSNYGADLGWANDLTLQGTTYTPLPISYYIRGDISRPDSARDNDANDLEDGIFQIGIRPTLTDSLYLFGNRIDQEIGYPGQISNPAPFNEIVTEATLFGGAWSHVISERNVIQAFAVKSDTESRRQFRTRESIDEQEIVYRINEKSRDEYFTYGVGHMLGIGPLTLRYGAEAAETNFKVAQTATNLTTGGTEDLGSFSGDSSAVRTYVDGYLDLTESLQFQAGAYVSRFDGESGLWGPVDFRLGVAWAPTDKHWLRAYYRQDTQFVSNYTLAPVTTVGLSPMELPLFFSGQTETTAARWDAEWSERFFTSVEYQHQRFNGLTLAPEDLMTTFLTGTGTIDRLQLSANYWVGDGLGVFGSFTWNTSKDTSEFWDPSFDVPLIPDYVAQVGFTYVHPARWTATVAQSFVGPRLGSQYYDADDNPVGVELDSYSTTDAALTWKSESGHLEAGLSVLNIFDNDIDMADRLPAPGRTFLATMKARF
ncbi:FecR domain-containing protein [Shinella sp.]|uniref:FecR domain-containing protein n=1 Tax=Shinella sp. TaxID=1870904 RepID=UPI0029B4DBA6|nr:FecR domain-containing protein [Shinella sp.]MDX3977952.1 FecR domain-containing protein [Shinella sp.]